MIQATTYTICVLHAYKEKFLHTNAYFAFLICRLVHRLHEHMAVLLADPTKITHWFTHNNVWQKFAPVATKCCVCYSKGSCSFTRSLIKMPNCLKSKTI